MKDLSYISLLDIYGKALTEKQHRIITDYYERDFSLSEIADNLGISRQAVHSAIRQAEDSLRFYEERMGFCSFLSQLNRKTAEIKSELEQNGIMSEKFAEFEDFIRSNYGTVQ